MLLPRQLEQLGTLHPGAYGWALLCCGRDRDRAADVLQTSYARIIGGEAVFSGRSELRSFLFGVVRRVALEDERKRSRVSHRDQVAFSQAVERGPAPSPSAEVERSELQEGMQCALLRLPARQREILHLHFYEGLSLQEAAEVLGIGVGSARQHYERGKNAMRIHCQHLKEPAHARSAHETSYGQH